MTLPNLKLGSCTPASPERAARLFTPLPAKPTRKPPVEPKRAKKK